MPTTKFVGTSLVHVAIIGVLLDPKVHPDDAGHVSRDAFYKKFPNAYILKEQHLGVRSIRRKGYSIYAFTFADP